MYALSERERSFLGASNCLGQEMPGKQPYTRGAVSRRIKYQCTSKAIYIYPLIWMLEIILFL